jgi:predicted PurR-regulated permease PerM
MNMKKGESRQELLNRAFFYVLFIGIAIIIFLRVKPLIFDLFVAIVLAALAEPVVYRLSKKFGRKISALIAVFVILFVIFGIIFSLVPIMVQEIYFLSTQLFHNLLLFFLLNKRR